ncbi:MAG: membrane protein insertase YidC [Bacteroidaceae bacterium]
MDKNTIIGFVLIGLVLIGFSIYSRPSQEEIERMKRYNDSIALVEQQKAAQEPAAEAKQTAVINLQVADTSALFFDARQGNQAYHTLENDVLRLTVATKGGRVCEALLKDYNGQDGQPLVLFNEKESSLNFTLNGRNEVVDTEDLYFTPVDATDSTLTMRLQADASSYLDFVYTLTPGSYLVDFRIQAVGLRGRLDASTRHIGIDWKQSARQIEKGFKFEERYATLSYRLCGDDTEELNANKDQKKQAEGRMDWVAFKNQFFSSVIIAEQDLEQGELSSAVQREGSGYLKQYAARMNTAFDPSGKEPTQLLLYYGPNKYKTLLAIDKNRGDKKDLELNTLVPLGWSFLRWINRWFTIPIFDWLSGWGWNMGIVLLIMTLIVKMVVFPFTYKSYLSSAKMRVLKPQIDVINQKYPRQEDAMKKQQEIMALYSRYGVSPMGGCLPMLIQMPIFLALFMFVPTAIELRQQSFLWAADLSTYDAFLTWNTHIPFIGRHLSLFCLLFSVTNILNTMYTMRQQDTGQQSMPGMKLMMYAMPVMFIFILNDYASGLNYYYFISGLISIVTMIILKKTVSDQKILAQLEANLKNPKKKKKSSLMERMQAMQQEQERLMREREKQNRR